MRHNQPGQHRAAQPRPTLADQLESMTCRFDALTQRARLSEQTRPSQAEHDEQEAIAHGIARDLFALFRGRACPPTNPPRYVSPDGTKAGW